MGIIESVRSHFGGRWKSDIRVLGRDEFLYKLDELQREINHLQAACNRLRMADRREASRGPIAGSDIRVVSKSVEDQLAALHGWTVSLVETVFVLIGLETEEESKVRAEWKRNL